MAENETTETAGPKKAARSKIVWLDNAGVVTTEMGSAKGLRHTVLSTGSIYDLMFADCAEAMPYAGAHGAKQKSGDSASSARANAIKLGDDPDAAEDAAVFGFHELMREGTWAGGRGESVAGIAGQIAALVRAKKIKANDEEGLAACAAYVNSLDEEGHKAFLKRPPIKTAIAALHAERLAAKAKESGDSLDDIAL